MKRLIRISLIMMICMLTACDGFIDMNERGRTIIEAVYAGEGTPSEYRLIASRSDGLESYSDIILYKDITYDDRLTTGEWKFQATAYDSNGSRLGSTILITDIDKTSNDKERNDYNEVYLVIYDEDRGEDGSMTYLWNNASASYSVIDIKNNVSVVEIPSTFNGYPVKEVSDKNFGYNSHATALKVGDNVTYIGSRAFHNYSALKDVRLGKAVTEISYYAFSSCYALETITIPKSLKTIYPRAFNYCSSLKTITYSGTVSEWNSIELVIDDGDSTGYWFNSVPSTCTVITSDGVSHALDTDTGRIV